MSNTDNALDTQAPRGSEVVLPPAEDALGELGLLPGNAELAETDTTSEASTDLVGSPPGWYLVAGRAHYFLPWAEVALDDVTRMDTEAKELALPLEVGVPNCGTCHKRFLLLEASLLMNGQYVPEDDARSCPRAEPHVYCVVCVADCPLGLYQEPSGS